MGCECLKLAEATHSCPEAIPFSYCFRVLQKRYPMKCRHGERGVEPEDGGKGSQWRVDGDIDPVQAILIRNA